MLEPEEDIIEAAAVFCAFLTPFVALITGLALVSFTPLKQVPQPKKLLLTGLLVGGITALGWGPTLLLSSIGLWVYLGVVVISIIYGTVVIFFVSAEVLTEKMIDEPAHRSLRAQYNYIF